MSTGQNIPPPQAAGSQPSEYDNPERKRGARLFIIETVFGAMPVGVQSNFSSAFALKMGATNSQMGYLSAVGELFSVVTQLVAPRLVGLVGGRKRMVIIATLVSTIPWALLIVVPFLPDSIRVWTAIVMVGLSLTIALMGDPAWGSWMSDLVPVRRRGRWMGRRGSMAIIVYVTIGLIGAFALDELGDAVKWGFIAAFVLALAARTVSATLFSKVKDPKPGLRLTPVPPPWKLVGMVTAKTRLGGFYLYMLTMHIGVMFAAPFFSVYMLTDLGMSYTQFVIAGVANSFAQMLTLPFWGRVADKRGNYFLLVFNGIIFSIWPITFVLIQEVWYVYVAMIGMGVATAGWGMCHYNLVLENSTDEERPRAVALYRVTASLGAFAGAMVAAIVAPHVPKLFTYQIMTMFVISSVLRGAATALVLPRLRGKAAVPS